MYIHIGLKEIIIFFIVYIASSLIGGFIHEMLKDIKKGLTK